MAGPAGGRRSAIWRSSPQALLVLAVAALTVAAVILNRSLWLDEAMLYLAVEQDGIHRPGQPLSLFEQSLPYGTYLIYEAAAALVGSDDRLLRAPSLVAYAGGLLLLYRTCRSVADPLLALLSTAMAAFGWNTVVQASSLKHYSFEFAATRGGPVGREAASPASDDARCLRFPPRRGARSRLRQLRAACRGSEPVIVPVGWRSHPASPPAGARAVGLRPRGSHRRWRLVPAGVEAGHVLPAKCYRLRAGRSAHTQCCVAECPFADPGRIRRFAHQRGGWLILAVRALISPWHGTSLQRVSMCTAAVLLVLCALLTVSGVTPFLYVRHVTLWCRWWAWRWQLPAQVVELPPRRDHVLVPGAQAARVGWKPHSRVGPRSTCNARRRSRSWSGTASVTRAR